MRSCVRWPSVEFDPAWRTDTTTALAAEIAGGNVELLPILADALQDSGCTTDPLLAHLREPVLHHDGCWLAPVLRQLQFTNSSFTAWAGTAQAAAWYREGTGHASEHINAKNARPGDMPLFRFDCLPPEFEELPDLAGPFGVDLGPLDGASGALKKLVGRRGLCYLALQHSPTTRHGWNRLTDLPDLKRLFLWGDTVDEPACTALHAAKQIESLALARAGVHDLARFAEMAWLKTLIIRDNTHLGENAVAALAMHPNLEELNIATIRTTDGAFDGLTTIPNLRRLTAFDCKVTDAALTRLPNLVRLELLNLGGCPITDASMERIARLPELRRLYLWQTNVTNIGLKALAGRTDLRELYLSNLWITDTGLAAIATLTGLQKLQLRSTKVTDAGMKYLAQLTDLRELNLDSTQVTNAGLKPLKALTRLQSFSASFSRIDERAREEFVASLPNCGP